MTTYYNRKQSGFTLIELMITITLMIVLAGLSIPSFNNFTKNQNLRQAVKKLKTDLRSAQNKAVNGVDRDDKEGWGISFVNGQNYYTLCAYDEGTALCNAVSNSDNFPEGITITSPGSFFVAFQMITGEVINPGTVVEIGYSGGSTKSILVDSAGNIEEM